ncbi:MAG: hypothetical protein ACYCOU_24370 [Sulfobacillus sp.]
MQALVVARTGQAPLFDGIPADLVQRPGVGSAVVSVLFHGKIGTVFRSDFSMRPDKLRNDPHGGLVQGHREGKSVRRAHVPVQGCVGALGIPKDP